MNQRSLALIVLVAVVFGFAGLIIWDAKVNNRLGLQNDNESNWKWEDEWDGTTPEKPDPRSEVKPDPKPEEQEIQKPNTQVTASSYSEALKEAGKYGMPVFVYFGADWCSWCQKMKRETLSDSKIEEIMKNYVFVDINTDKDKETTRKFSVRSLPSYVVTNCKEDKLKNGEGYESVNSFSKWLNDSSLFDQPKEGGPSKTSSKFVIPTGPFTGQGSLLK